MSYEITKDGWLLIDGKPCKRDIIPGGAVMQSRRFVVNHFTGGADGDGDTDGDHIKDSGSLGEVLRARGLSVHFGVDRDGTIIQYRSCQIKCAHAGGSGMSIWQDEHTGKFYNGNDAGIGIEICNAGDDPGAQKWAIRKAGASVRRAKHRNGDTADWEVYPEVQIAAVIALNKAVVVRYNLTENRDGLTGHDCISSWRKADPGPLFPMLRVREACGFSGLPRVLDRNGRVIG